MILSEAQVAQFRERGFTAQPGFFSKEETAAMQAEIARLMCDGLLRNVATEGDGKTHSVTKRNLQLCPMYRHSPLFRALPFHPKVIEAVEQLLGGPIVLRLDQVFLKPARDGAGTNWHADNAYFRISDPLAGTAMWIAIHDASVANGTIHVIPDSFRERFEHSRDPESDHHIRCYPPEERALPIELPAGGVAFFCYSTVHCTRGNRTDRDRAGVALHFIREACAHEDRDIPEEGTRAYFPVLSGANASGGLNEYGVRVAGTWASEVRRTMSMLAADRA